MTRVRVDSYGVVIRRGGKKHNIAFKEQMERVHIVESWKKYNQEIEA